MKTIKEIYARTVILQCLTDRCCLDMDWGAETCTIQECETDRKHILNWLQDKGYYPYTTGQEQSMFELPVGAKKFKKDELIEIDVQCKAMDILLWTLCKTSLIPDLSEAGDKRALQLADKINEVFHLLAVLCFQVDIG